MLLPEKKSKKMPRKKQAMMAIRHKATMMKMVTVLRVKMAKKVTKEKRDNRINTERSKSMDKKDRMSRKDMDRKLTMVQKARMVSKTTDKRMVSSKNNTDALTKPSIKIRLWEKSVIHYFRILSLQTN